VSQKGFYHRKCPVIAINMRCPTPAAAVTTLSLFYVQRIRPNGGEMEVVFTLYIVQLNAQSMPLYEQFYLIIKSGGLN